jgi:microcystin-dependent protein
MPSTYSPSLKIELIGNGEQASNWGNTTNYNLGTLIEQAITGVTAIVMVNADRTLTSSNGTSDESRNAVLVLSSSVNLTTTRNLIVPSVNKLYTVSNQTSGGQAVVVKTSAGTGVGIGNGYAQLVYCDGTNVTPVTLPFNPTNGNIFTAGSASIGGDLAVAGSVTVSGSPIMPTGAMLEYGGASAPTGWLLCNGAAVSRATYAALFAVLGTTYGAGDGSTTFNVPNKIDRVGVGAGSSYARGATGGAATATTDAAGSHNHTGSTGGTAITTDQMPSHNHGITDPGHAHSTVGVVSDGNFGSGGLAPYPGGTVNTGGSGTGITINNAGNGNAHNHSISTDGLHSHSVSTIQPYLASSYIIKT